MPTTETLSSTTQVIAGQVMCLLIPHVGCIRVFGVQSWHVPKPGRPTAGASMHVHQHMWIASCRSTSVSNLMYIKEDLILQHNLSFYDLIISKARGKSGPLFHFDVYDDVRLEHNANVEKEESHAGTGTEVLSARNSFWPLCKCCTAGPTCIAYISRCSRHNANH